MVLLLVVTKIHVSQASVGSLGAAAASGVQKGKGGIRSREEAREAFLMQAISATVGIVLLIGSVYLGYKGAKVFAKMRTEENSAALFHKRPLHCPSGIYKPSVDYQ